MIFSRSKILKVFGAFAIAGCTFLLFLNCSAKKGLDGSSSLTSNLPSTTNVTLVMAGPTSLKVGFCQSLSLGFATSSGTAVPAAANLVLNLSNAGLGSYYSDSACRTQITQITLAQGKTSASFYYKDTDPEQVYLFANDNSGTVTSNYVSIPVSVSALKLPTSVVADSEFNDWSSMMCAILSTNQIWCWTSTGTQGTPVKIYPANEQFIDIALSTDTLYGLAADGSVWASDRQDGKHYLIPDYAGGAPISKPKKIIVYPSYSGSRIAVGRVCVLQTDGKLYCENSSPSIAFSSNYLQGLALVETNVQDVTSMSPVYNIYDSNMSNNPPTTVCSVNTAGAINCSGYILSGNSNSAWTASSSSAFMAQPMSTGSTGAVSIAGTFGSACALMSNSTAQCWGGNSYEWAASSLSGCTTMACNTTYAFPSILSNLVKVASNSTLTNISQIYANYFLLSDGSLQYLGGLTGFTNISSMKLAGTPKQIGGNLSSADSGDSVCVILDTGAVQCFQHLGSNGYCFNCSNTATTVNFLSHSLGVGIVDYITTNHIASNGSTQGTGIFLGQCNALSITDSINGTQSSFYQGATVSFTSTSPNITFYSDANCSQAISSMLVTDAQTQNIVVYFKDAAAESSSTITVTMPLSNPQSTTFASVGSATSLALVGNLTTNGCAPITAYVVDSNNYSLTFDDATTIAISTALPTAQTSAGTTVVLFANASTCSAPAVAAPQNVAIETIPAGQSSAKFSILLANPGLSSCGSQGDPTAIQVTLTPSGSFRLAQNIQFFWGPVSCGGMDGF